MSTYSNHGQGRTTGTGRGRASRRGPEKVERYLASALRDLGVPSRKLGRTLHEAWAGICEPAWRDRTWLVGHEGGVLRIGVSSAALREELVQYHAARLLELMRTSMPDVALAALRFVVEDRPVDPSL